MEVIPITCPKCGGAVQVPSGEKSCYCTFCGTQLFLEDGSRTVTYRVIDEARIREAEAMQAVETVRSTTELSKFKISIIVIVGLLLLGLALPGIGYMIAGY